ncbi:MAG: Uncharacterised protein [SAR116 cluster bacterium]|nr:MAG: Uncharacterised protein [SAR116 cluster bacterium]
MGDAIFRLFQRQPVNQLLEPLAVFGKVDRIRAGAKDRNAGIFQRCRNLQRGLATKLYHHPMHGAIGGFTLDDLDHILICQRLEIQPVRSVIIGRYRFRITVDHDGFIAGV